VQDNISKTSFSVAEKTGICSLVAACLLFFIAPSLAILVLSMFLLLCFAAPFFPEFGFYLPVICRGEKGERGVALTFDDGPSPSSTPIVLDLLARHNLQATFFVVGEKAAEYPELIEDIIAGGHTIGNHSWNHDYFLMLRSRNNLQKDIYNTQEILKKSGIQPLVFRPPVGITSPHLESVLSRENLITITYSCRAYDRGNRNIHNLAEKIQRRLQPGDIIMLHDLPPYRRDEMDYWQKELDQLFGILAGNYETAPLEHITGRPVMKIL
jgi:peptidoglycan/xylan/chitin deacetylase (PgdA/CDA1 family)